ncbi:MAG: DUF2591 family protein [Burkholderiales bacterium]|nr:DUF2591 family protein [Burkholderiales bacterium]
MNVKRLEGRQLNYWVAMSAGLKLAPAHQPPGLRHDPQSGYWHPHNYNPAGDWSQAGAILSDEWFAIEDAMIEWFGLDWPHIPAIVENPLTWFMRAFVASQYGNEVEDMTPPYNTLEFSTDATPLLVPGQTQSVANKSTVPPWMRIISW